MKDSSRVLRLTARELQILDLLAHGHSSVDIAKNLFISEETVQSHRKNILRKFGARNVAQLIAIAFRNDILK